ncbi:TonB family protein [Mucilaginibacter myungsuensis]|uniref:TonB family protein n=1 Tax=Mucilaginibacter myungsuensis TaxID=649104 RepID=A0A929L0W2_9SPHI|nr:TonB family protein [Mucilaginibacter myungsuensis]MBE9662459.1 TonB family protein [Mucilaginibacter myungsuensis]MDN3597879.1 TonB family protein [Mucilaginibacter myungsuensis]
MPKLFKIALLVFALIPMVTQARASHDGHIRPDTVNLKKTFLPLITYMERGLRYPSDARYNKVQGNVIIQFELTADGTIANTEFVNANEVKQLGNGLGDEATKMLKKFKDKKKELPAGVYFLPVTYVFDTENPPAAIAPTFINRPNCLYQLIISTAGFR